MGLLTPFDVALCLLGMFFSGAACTAIVSRAIARAAYRDRVERSAATEQLLTKWNEALQRQVGRLQFLLGSKTPTEAVQVEALADEIKREADAHHQPDIDVPDEPAPEFDRSQFPESPVSVAMSDLEQLARQERRAGIKRELEAQRAADKRNGNH